MLGSQAVPETGVGEFGGLPTGSLGAGLHFLDSSGPQLPSDLDFLVFDDPSIDALVEVVQRTPQDVYPHEVLLSEGAVSEDTYYRALAQRLGCVYYEGGLPFGASFSVSRALRSGVAPLWGEGTPVHAVIAPRGSSISRLIDAVDAGALKPACFAIASPNRLATLIRARRPKEVLSEALGKLPKVWSSHTGLTWAQTFFAAVLVVACLGVGLVSASILEAALSSALWLLFLSAIVLRSMAAVASGAPVRTRLLTDNELPIYTVVVPVYREERVVADLVRALNALNYPKSKLDIKIVLEQDDRKTLQRLLDLQLPGCYELIVAPDGQPRTKPRALNIGLASARGEFLTVYDAEDAPAPGQLRLAASHFFSDASIDCLQARLSVRNASDSWLSRCFEIEYAVLFGLINPGLCSLRFPIALGGTSNHFRVRSLVAAGGWDEWNVAEDADLGVRLARLGYRVASLDSETSEEAPCELANWFGQRVRWQKGWMQTCIVHSRNPLRLIRELGGGPAAACAFLLVGGVTSALFWPLFAWITVARALAAIQADSLSGWREATDVLVYVLAFSGVWVTVIPALVAVRTRKLNSQVGTLALLPFYYLLVCAAAWTAVFDLARRPHHWTKTSHGKPERRPAPLAASGAARVALPD